MVRKLLILCSFFLASPAHASFCLSPKAPSAVYLSKPIKPTKPICASFQNCDEWQIQSFNNDVDRYNSYLKTFYQNLEEYTQDVEKYIKKAAEYIECMSSN